jgi:hypothetical protein
VTEAELDVRIRGRVEQMNLIGFSSPDSRRTQRGWPDWAIMGPRGVLFRELKTEPGTLTYEQSIVGGMLQKAGASWGIWRPSDWLDGIIMKELEAIA